MANEVKLEVYTFRIKERYRSTSLNLDSFFEKNDFFKFFSDFINSLTKNISVDEINKKSLQFISEYTTINSADRMISGIVESGEYGISGRLVDRKTKQTKYKKTIDDLDVKPFYFLFSAPAKSSIGFLVLNRIGGAGINGIFTDAISQLFKNTYEDFIVEFSPLLSQKLAKELINKDSIREVRLRRYRVPGDVIDKLGLTGHEDDVMSIEIKIRAKKNKYLPFSTKVKSFIKNPDTAFFDIKELKNLGFDGKNDSSIRIGTGKSSRVVDLKESFQLRPYYDIDKDIKKEKTTQYPVFDSIDVIAKKTLNELINETTQ